MLTYIKPSVFVLLFFSGSSYVFAANEEALAFPLDEKILPEQVVVTPSGAQVKEGSFGPAGFKEVVMGTMQEDDGTPPLQPENDGDESTEPEEAEGAFVLEPESDGEGDLEVRGGRSLTFSMESVGLGNVTLHSNVSRSTRKCKIPGPKKACAGARKKSRSRFKRCKQNRARTFRFCKNLSQRGTSRCPKKCARAKMCCLFFKNSQNRNLPIPTPKPRAATPKTQAPTPKPQAPTPRPSPSPTCERSCGSSCIGENDDCCDDNTGFQCTGAKCWMNQFNFFRCLPWDTQCVGQCGHGCLEAGDDCCDASRSLLCKGKKCWTNSAGEPRCIPSDATICPKGHWCAAGKTCCGNGCIEEGEGQDTCCDDNLGLYCDSKKCVRNSAGEFKCAAWDAIECSQDRWCSSSQMCCGSSCCNPITHECCNGKCIPKGTTCCPSGNYCAADKDCYNEKCYPKGVSICPNGNFCSNTAQTCCNDPSSSVQPDYRCYSPRCPLPGVAKTIRVQGSENIFSFDYPKYHKWCNLRKYRKGWRVKWDATFTENIVDDLKDVVEDAVKTATKECVVEAVAISGAYQAVKCILTAGVGCVEWATVFKALLVAFGRCIGPNIIDQLQTDVTDYVESIVDRLKEAIQIESYDEKKSDIYCHWPCDC